MEKFDRKDVRFLLACLLAIAAGAAITGALFRRAFPEASIEFRVNRQQARLLAEKFLASRGQKIADHRFAARFAVDEEPKVYLERELGLERAGGFYGDEAKVWIWQMRWFRSGVKEEERVSVTPKGDLVSFESVLREDAPGARVSRGEARDLASRFLSFRSLEAASLVPIEATPVSRPKRTDWIFVDEKKGFRMKEATVRYETTVAGDKVTAFREYVHVPEAWQRDYEKLRSKNEAAGTVATFGFVLTMLAMLAVLVTKIVRRDVPWRLVAAFGVIGFLLTLLSSLNAFPLTLFDYETQDPLSSHLTSQIVLGILGALASGAFIAIIVAGSEPPYRERFRQQLSLRGMFSWRGLSTKGFFKGVLLGYALTAFFFAYQAAFYVVAASLGAWAPAEIPYSDMLNTAIPWAIVLFIGFFPAVSEEGVSRMFSISFLDRLGVGRLVAVVVPAVIWGFGHASYPNQPFYIRGIEVGVAGVLIGFLMIKYGVLPLLVWHFTVDALWTALLMLRSGNAYYVVSGAVASGILLLPLAVSLLLYLRRGGFAPAAGLTNSEEGFVPAPPRPPPLSEEIPQIRPVRRKVLAAAAGAAVLFASSFLFPTYPREPLVQDSTGRGRAERLGHAFLKANGVSSEKYRMVSYLGTGFPDDEAVRFAKPAEEGRIPGFSEEAARYVLQKGGVPALRRLSREKLPLAYWVVRFLEPDKKEEWKVLVDAGRGRVVGFVNPKEEKAPAAATVSAERARQRALSAARVLGFPAAEYSVLDVGTQARPNRTDTTVVLESRPAGAGDTRPRLTAVFHGARLAAFYPSVRVPEEFLRQYRKSEVFDWLLIAARVVAIGAFVGVGIVLFLRIVRRADFRWRALVKPLLYGALVAALALANSAPTALRQYKTEISLSIFQLTAAMGLLIGWLGLLVAAGVGFVLFFAARPGWRRALRCGSLPDAFARAGVAAVGLSGISHWTSVAAARFPALFDPDPTLPGALENVVPGFAVFWSATLATFALASIAAVIALAASQPFFRKPVVLALAVLALFLVVAPTTLRSPEQFVADFLPELLVAGWIALCAFLLLRDHVAAWVLFGAFSYGGRAALELLAQPAASDRVAGWTALVLILLGVAALVVRRPETQVPRLPEAAG